MKPTYSPMGSEVAISMWEWWPSPESFRKEHRQCLSECPQSELQSDTQKHTDCWSEIAVWFWRIAWSAFLEERSQPGQGPLNLCPEQSPLKQPRLLSANPQRLVSAHASFLETLHFPVIFDCCLHFITFPSSNPSTSVFSVPINSSANRERLKVRGSSPFSSPCAFYHKPHKCLFPTEPRSMTTHRKVNKNSILPF